MAIYKKLLDFQKLNITVKKDGQNPHFRSNYATLNEVLDKVKGPLNDLGIVIVQRPEVRMEVETGLAIHTGSATSMTKKFSGGSVVHGLVTELIDTEDDTKVECFMPYVGATDAQKLGSANTYVRRYSLVTLLGLEDEDDDGNAASATRSVLGGATRRAQGPVEAMAEPFEGNPFKDEETGAAGDLESISYD